MKARSGFDLCRDLIPEDLVFLLVSWLGGNYFFFFFLNHQTIRVKRQALSCKKPQIAPKIPWGNSLNPDLPPRQSFPRAEGLRLLQARPPGLCLGALCCRTSPSRPQQGPADT